MNHGKPVLILGGGINGAALARELVLNRVPVIVVDTADLASGTTAYSSRLVHGGLRYLEFGELDLVRQALGERTELLRQAPHLVRPLRIFIPVRARRGGMLRSAKRLLGVGREDSEIATPRGLWLIRTGLALYDAYARGSTLPKHAVHSVGEPGVPPIDGSRFRWLCSYYDAQVAYAELLAVAMLEDARRIGAQMNVPLQVYTYHEARLDGCLVHLHRVKSSATEAGDPSPRAGRGPLRPAAIVNTTGAWVDRTLNRMHVAHQPLLGGTRGSHLLTTNRRIASALAGRGVYVEADDGRPVFILPLGSMTLIGTTDLPFDGDPRTVVATEAEVEYLLGVVREVFPEITLTRSDLELTYAGVRPLPATSDDRPAAITRRHHIEEHSETDVPMFSLVGGKLTTCRAVAEEMAARLLARLKWPVIAQSRGRALPGGDDYPADGPSLDRCQREIANRYAVTLPQVQAVWSRCGTRTDTVFASRAGTTAKSGTWGDEDFLPSTDLPRVLAEWVIRSQWVTTVSDLVERRLMLLFEPRLSRRCIFVLAELLGAQRGLTSAQIQSQARACCERLRTHFGKVLVDLP